MWHTKWFLAGLVALLGIAVVAVTAATWLVSRKA